MASPERKISAGPPSAVEPSTVEARLASLEDEAARLRTEVAALQDEIRCLTDEDEEYGGDPAALSRGWLARGWLRASLLMTVVAIVALVSVPYFLHLLDASARSVDPAPVAANPSVSVAAPVTSPAPGAPAALAAGKAAARGYIPAPLRVRATEIPAPTLVRAEERPRVSTNPRADAADVTSNVPAPGRGESP